MMCPYGKKRKHQPGIWRSQELRRGVNFVEIDEAKAAIAPSREPMSERVDNMLAVAFQNSVVSIVQQNDVAALGPTQAANHRGGRLRLPIPCQRGPHYYAEGIAPRAALANHSI